MRFLFALVTLIAAAKLYGATPFDGIYICTLDLFECQKEGPMIEVKKVGDELGRFIAPLYLFEEYEKKIRKMEATESLEDYLHSKKQSTICGRSYCGSDEEYRAWKTLKQEQDRLELLQASCDGSFLACMTASAAIVARTFGKGNKRLVVAASAIAFFGCAVARQKTCELALKDELGDLEEQLDEMEKEFRKKNGAPSYFPPDTPSTSSGTTENGANVYNCQKNKITIKSSIGDVWEEEIWDCFQVAA